MRFVDAILRLPLFGLVLPSGKDTFLESTDNRRRFLGALGGAFGSIVVTESLLKPAAAAETIGKDPECNDRSCLGVWDGLLADCPHGMKGGAGCTSSQDDTPGIFSEP